MKDKKNAFVADDADLWNETLALDVLESAVCDAEQGHSHNAPVQSNNGELEMNIRLKCMVIVNSFYVAPL